MLELEIRELLSRGRELPGVEFKSCRPRTDKLFAAKVVKACLAMVNRRDGGYVVIGVEDDGKGHVRPVGLEANDAATWNENDVADTLTEYADPSISIESEEITVEGVLLVVIRVHEFHDTPILCKKEYRDILRKGACYVRTRRKPETVEIPSQEDMRELLELATDKRLRHFVSQAHSAGLLPVAAAGPSDDDSFNAQLSDLTR